MTVAASMRSYDPFTLVEQLLWFAMESHPEVTGLVGLQNRLKLNADTDNPFAKTNLTGADVPELIIMPAGGDADRPGDGASSDTNSLTCRWIIGITTDETRTHLKKSASAVKWAVLRALWRLRNTGAYDLPFVNLIRAVPIADQLTDPTSRDRGAQGWKAVITVDVRMHFPFMGVAA